MTRDGRLVINLREATLDNCETILLGEVSQKPLARYKRGDIINTENHWWPGRGAWGNHGDDDLIMPSGEAECGLGAAQGSASTSKYKYDSSRRTTRT